MSACWQTFNMNFKVSKHRLHGNQLRPVRISVASNAIQTIDNEA
jgi:hypothetical protein